MKDLNVREWFDEIQQGLDYRRSYGLEDKWNELDALFSNVHDSQAHEGPNIVASTGDSLVSSLVVPRPTFAVHPEDIDSVEGSKILEKVDNQLVHQLFLKQELEKSLTHTYLWGRGIWKIGFDSEFGYDPRQDTGLGTLNQFDSRGHFIERIPPRPGMPWVLSVLPHDFIVPWGTVDLKDAPWCCHRVVRHISDVKGDRRYKNTTSLKPIMTMKDFIKSYESRKVMVRMGDEYFSRRGDPTGHEYIELWEIHDRRTEKIIVLATGHDKKLRDERDYLQIDGGLPFISISLRLRPRTFWTTPDAFYLRHAQLELSDIALQSQKNRRLSVLKFFYAQNMISDEQLEGLLSPDAGAGIGVEGDDVRNVVAPFAMPFNENIRAEEEFTRRDSREVVGFSRNQVGEFEQRGRRTASEVLAVQRGSDIRLSRRSDKVADFYVDTIRKVNEIIFRYWRIPRTVMITGEDGLPAWMQFTGSSIRGRYNYSLGFSSEPELGLTERRQQALQLYSIMAQDPMVNQEALRRYLSDAFNDPEFSQIWTQPDAALQLPVQAVQGNDRRAQENTKASQANLLS